MRTILVRYQTKPDRADENERLVEKVFSELEARAPDNFRYASLRLEDGVTFVHIVTELSAGLSLTDVDAFQEFVRGVEDRCDVPPVAQGVHVVGQYGFEFA